jgi:hypothetical protein
MCPPAARPAPSPSLSLLGRKQAPPVVTAARSPWTTHESELERRDDTLALLSEEQRDPGRGLLDSS